MAHSKQIEEVKIILGEMNQNRINYALMRNIDFLSNKEISVGKDIDILILNKDVQKINKIFEEHKYFKQPISPFSKHIGFAKYVPEEFKLIKFHFHIDGISGRNIIYLDGQKLLDRKKKLLDYHTLSDEDTLLNLIYHYKSSYEMKLNNLITNKLDLNYIIETLKNKINTKLAKDLTDAIQEKDINKLLKLRTRVKKSLVNSLIKLIKVSYITIGSVLWKIPKLFRKSPMITFMGMDGAGKTTTTYEMIKILDENHIKSALIYTGRGKNNLLPIQFFGRKFKKIEMKRENTDKNYEKEKPSLKKKIIYSIAAPFFAFDLICRYYIQIWSNRKTKDIVLTDRYSTDLMLMKNVPHWWKRYLYAISPKPSKVIYLYNDIKVLHKRKPGHPYDDLIRQEKLFEKINEKLKPIKIKNEDFEETKKTVSDIVFNEILKGWN